MDLAIRHGFTRIQQRISSLHRASPSDRGAMRTRYNLRDSISTVTQELCSTRDSSHVLFIDDGISTTNRLFDDLDEVLRSNPSIPFISLNSDLLPALFGKEDYNQQSVIPVITSRGCSPCFCVVHKSLLKRALADYPSVVTLEYMLLLCLHQLKSLGIKPLLLANHNINVSKEDWWGDAISKGGENLALDYSNLCMRGMYIPPQMRLRYRGERIDDHISGRHNYRPPSFSILCPVFRAKYLRECIASVTSQTYNNWTLELLVDGPPDTELGEIRKIINRASKSDIRIRCRYQTNTGTGIARRKLAESCTGDYVISLDDDDLFLPETLQTFAEVVSQAPTVNCIRASAETFGVAKRLSIPRRRLAINGISCDFFECTQVMAIKRSTLIDLGGFLHDQNLGNAGEDTDLLHRLDLYGIEPALISEVLYRRRLSETNQTLTFQTPSVFQHLQTLRDRYCPRGWQFVNCRFESSGAHNFSETVFEHARTREEIVAPTSFFVYHTHG
ncbi:hypothetical protein BH11PLA2_BH11PLA2_22570 [soil metagenome]